MNYSALKSLLIAHEGVRSRRYLDTRGKRTIGVGYNLDKSGGQAEFVSVLPHLNYANILAGTMMLSSDDIQTLLDHSIAIAIDDAKFLVPSFDAQPENVQYVLVDLAFNMGRPVLSEFKRFLSAVEREDYPAAASALTNSAWFHEVGKRAQDDIALLQTAANYRTFPDGGASSAPAAKS
jgi:GH24 family phage-related lysozyme (muramidase)